MKKFGVPKKVKIKVTAKDIKNGKRRSCKACPIALAASRVFKRSVSADGDILVKDDFGNELVYVTPFAAMDFMKYFDDGDKVKPISFTVRFGGTY